MMRDICTHYYKYTIPNLELSEECSRMLEPSRAAVAASGCNRRAVAKAVTIEEQQLHGRGGRNLGAAAELDKIRVRRTHDPIGELQLKQMQSESSS